MSRDLSGGVTQNLEQDVIYPFFAIELLFDTGTFESVAGQTTDRILRLWTGIGTLNFENTFYYGTGSLLDVSAVEETVDMAARGATLSLSGVPSSVISLALTEQYQGRQAKIYFGLFQEGAVEDESSTELSPVYIQYEDGTRMVLESQETSLTEVFVGYMDQMNISEGPDTSSIELRLENKLIDLERQRVGRFTSEYQKSIYPFDKGFDFVEGMQDMKISWGR
jgi:hypothetical protein